MPSTRREAMLRCWSCARKNAKRFLRLCRKNRDQFCRTVDKLVLRETEEEEIRFRRRMHLHLCLGSVVVTATFMSAMSLLDIEGLMAVTFGVNGLTEFLDYVGRF